MSSHSVEGGNGNPNDTPEFIKIKNSKQSNHQSDKKNKGKGPGCIDSLYYE